MLIIGLTGGIGCGKSTVAELFQQHHIPVIDADKVAHEIVQPGLPVLKKITQEFGQNLLLEDGSLDRAALSKLVFADATKLKALEAIMHPHIRDEMSARIQAQNSPYCLSMIPLLIETGQHQSVDRVLVVDCSPETQKRRVIKRDQISLQQVELILNFQCSRQQRLDIADDVLNNDTDEIDSLQKEVESLHKFYLTLSKADS